MLVHLTLQMPQITIYSQTEALSEISIKHRTYFSLIRRAFFTNIIQTRRCCWVLFMASVVLTSACQRVHHKSFSRSFSMCFLIADIICHKTEKPSVTSFSFRKWHVCFEFVNVQFSVFFTSPVAYIASL